MSRRLRTAPDQHVRVRRDGDRSAAQLQARPAVVLLRVLPAEQVQSRLRAHELQPRVQRVRVLHAADQRAEAERGVQRHVHVPRHRVSAVSVRRPLSPDDHSGSELLGIRAGQSHQVPALSQGLLLLVDVLPELQQLRRLPRRAAVRRLRTRLLGGALLRTLPSRRRVRRHVVMAAHRSVRSAVRDSAALPEGHTRLRVPAADSPARHRAAVLATIRPPAVQQRSRWRRRRQLAEGEHGTRESSSQRRCRAVRPGGKPSSQIVNNKEDVNSTNNDYSNNNDAAACRHRRQLPHHHLVLLPGRPTAASQDGLHVVGEPQQEHAQTGLVGALQVPRRDIPVHRQGVLLQAAQAEPEAHDKGPVGAVRTSPVRRNVCNLSMVAAVEETLDGGRCSVGRRRVWC